MSRVPTPADTAAAPEASHPLLDAEIVEIIAHVALKTLTNYFNEVLGTEIDFPVVEALAA